MEDVVKEFLLESYENLDRLDRDFVELEKNPSRETLGSIFRVIHTIKGTCGFLGFSKLASITHAGESLLALLRAGRIQINSRITDSLLAMVDAVRDVLAAIESTGNEGDSDYSSLIETLSGLQQGAESLDLPASPLPLGELLVRQGRVRPEELDRALRQQAEGDPRRIGEILVALGAVTPPAILEALKTQKSTLLDGSVRVDLDLLDRLMNLVSELVLCRNQISHFAKAQDDPAFLAAFHHLNVVIAELQEGVMKSRMQPIGQLWNKFPRLVRDLAASCGKQVRIEVDGAETELDRNVIEAIRNPLTHIVRNAVDHGFESPEARLAAGKPEQGRLIMRAYHEGGQVNIEITDDGAGIDPKNIAAKALQRGLMTAEQLAAISEKEIVNLIFLPGFSTADQVTNLSGRGVGMEVVKTSIEKIGGVADIQSRAGEGMTVSIKIPLTLAIIPALIVTAGGDRYAIPQAHLQEIVRPKDEPERKGIEWIFNAPVLRLRGKLLPLVFLNHELNLEEKFNQRVDATVNILVLQANKTKFGLVVDAVHDAGEIVVKPLGRHLKGISAFSGATIMSDGQVALIVDVSEMAQRGRAVDEAPEDERESSTALAEESTGERHAWLIGRHGHERRIAMPLPPVARLEEFSRSAIERSGLREVVQYRGAIMPLIRLSHILGEESLGEDRSQEKIQVVVYRNRERSVGLVIDRILDIVEEPLAISRDDRVAGIYGSALIGGRVTDLLDVRSIIELAEPGFFDQSEAA